MSKTNASLMQRREAAVPRGVGQIHPIFAESAKNATVTDVEGREFIDFAGGIAVLNTGHVHPKIIAAVTEQLNKLTHTCFQVLAYEPYVELCEKVNAKVPGDFAKKTLLVTTGSEAVENAVKIARAATGRAGAIAFTGAYHGRTMMTLGLTGKVVPYSAGMGLMPGGVFRALFPNELHGVSDDDAIASIERIFKNDAEPRDIAAIIIEPVQGEGGFYVAPKSFMKRLRELCDKHGILLIADEVQTGMGRTGELFAYQHYGVTPDILTSAKSLGGGFPIAAMLTTEALAKHLVVGTHGTTYGGNPLACAVGNAVIDVVNTPEVLNGVKAKHQQFKTRLEAIGQQYGLFTEVRGMGLLIGCVLNDAWKGKAKDIFNACEKEDLMILQAGPDVVRFAPSLVVDEPDIVEGLNRFERAVQKLTHA